MNEYEVFEVPLPPNAAMKAVVCGKYFLCCLLWIQTL
jgi:hypothetical protein